MTLLTLPQLSISMEDGKVVRWLVADGAEVEMGEIVVEVETDKATVEVEAPADGVLSIRAKEGAIVPVDGVLAELRGGDERRRDADSDPDPGSALERVAPLIVPRSNGELGGRSIASPAARRLAAEHGIELAAVRGSGPGGRIVVRDLALGRPGAAAGIDGLREAIVRNVVASWDQIPHVHIGGELKADGLLGARTLLPEGVGRVTLTDLLVFALARALEEVPELNGFRRPDGTVSRSTAVNISLAVATPAGVVAPVLRDADSLSLAELAAERARLVEAARSGGLERRALAGGTVTLSNLGTHPVDFFAPVVSGPQLAMVATGRVLEKPVAEGGWIGVGARMWVNVAIDHRAADGEAGGRLLAALERRIAALPGALS